MTITREHPAIRVVYRAGRRQIAREIGIDPASRRGFATEFRVEIDDTGRGAVYDIFDLEADAW